MSGEDASGRTVGKQADSNVTPPGNLDQLGEILLKVLSFSGTLVCSSENRNLQVSQPGGWPPETGVMLPTRYLFQETTNGDGRVMRK